MRISFKLASSGRGGEDPKDFPPDPTLIQSKKKQVGGNEIRFSILNRFTGNIFLALRIET